jgi:predicted transcriptional regulator
MSLTVRIPDELARRLEDAAAQRHVSAEQVALEAIASKFPDADTEDALEAFIGSGFSEHKDLARRHREILAEASGDSSARDL